MGKNFTAFLTGHNGDDLFIVESQMKLPMPSEKHRLMYAGEEPDTNINDI
jgi:hypothetical protein